MARVDGLDVIQCAISSEKPLQRRFARRSLILDPERLIPSHLRVLSSVNHVLINEFESTKLADGVFMSLIRVTT